MVHSSGSPHTFLFSDIEGSTQAWEEHRDSMGSAMARHDELWTEVISEFDGRLVKQTGDGVFAVFDEAPYAVAAALTAQREFLRPGWLADDPLRVRVGVHSGLAVARGSDLFGMEVNRAARLMASGHGGQILVSKPTIDLIGEALPDGATVRDLGTKRLRDLSEPVGVYQLEAPDIPHDFPPLLTMDGFPNNLPADVSSFVGRLDDIESVARLMEGTRLLSLTGAGGSGKTRLALQVAGDLLPQFSDGAWFVDLAGLTEPGLVARQIASTLHIREKAGRPWSDVLVEYLRRRDLLLILDNCEHLLESAASIVGRLLASSPDLKVMTTTREPLNVSGEVAWRVPTMELPAAGDIASLEELLSYEAPQLFVERALAARPDLELTDGDTGSIAEVCRRLDGLPLALELAAARVRVLSVAEIARNLGDRFSLLSGGSRSALPRHRTLEGAVSWSYEMLTDEDKDLFERLAVFSGGFDLDAATDVAGAGSLDGVASLVEKSLLSARPTPMGTRYRMLETVAAFGHQKLGDRFAEARNAHLTWALNLSTTAAGELDGPKQQEWLDRISVELDNLRTAMQWSLDRGEPMVGMVIAGSLYRYWYIRGVREGARWLEWFLDEVDDAPPDMRARALFAHGSLLVSQGRYQEAAGLLEESRAVFEELGMTRGAAYAIHYLIRARWGLVSPEEMRELIDVDLEMFRSMDDELGISLTLLFDALWYVEQDAVDELETVEELMALGDRVGAPQIVAHASEIPAVVAWFQGDLDTAAPLLAKAADIYIQIDNQQCAGHCLENTAGWAARSGLYEESAVLLGASSALREDTGIPVPHYESVVYDRVIEEIREQLGDSFDAAFDRGTQLSMVDALEYVKELTGSFDSD